MKTATKKIAALFFSLAGFAPLLFIIFATIKQQEIRRDMEHQLESKMLHTITLSKNNVHWVKDGKEIIINGRMFDIKSFESVDNDKICFKGLYDDDETALVSILNKNQQSDKNTSGKLLAQLFQILQASLNNISSELFITSIDNNYFPGTEQSLVSQYITILSPPPQV